MGEAAELQVRLAITTAFRYLFYPSSDAPKGHSYLRRETMPPQDQGDTDQDQSNVVVRVLRALQKALAADDPPKSGPYVKAKAWDRNQVEMSTEDLRRAFARKIGLPLLLDVNQLKRSIENGVKTQTWLYYAAGEDFAYDHESPLTVWQISDDMHLYAPEEARRLGLRIKGKWTPPQPPGGGATVEQEEDGPSDEELDALLGGGRPSQLRGHGVPTQAFQQILDQAQEHGAVALHRLELAFRGIEAGRANDLVAMGLAIPQMGKATFGIQLNLIVEFGDGANEQVTIKFQGGWERYQRIKQVSDALVKDKKLRSLNVEFRLVVDFDGDLALGDRQFGDMRDALTNMGVSTLDVSATPVYGETP